MPMKYLLGLPMAVKIVGWIHGVFFMVYVTLIAKMADEHRWSFKKSTTALIASLVPFGPFYFDWLLTKEELSQDGETKR